MEGGSLLLGGVFPSKMLFFVPCFRFPSSENGGRCLAVGKISCDYTEVQEVRIAEKNVRKICFRPSLEKRQTYQVTDIVCDNPCACLAPRGSGKPCVFLCGKSI